MAAQIMKREDIGPVLVVSDYNSRTLVGIVTDRDLAVQVVADGCDPHNTRVDEVMSSNPVTCRENDDTTKALRLMSDFQVRRVPIVDGQNRLIGIVAQADLARNENEEEVGEMVEEISQPYGTGSWMRGVRDPGWEWGEESAGTSTDRAHLNGSSIKSSLALGAVCLGFGAGIMYLFDPNRGRTRRAIARDKAASWCSSSSEMVSRTAQDLKNRAAGVASSTKTMWKSEAVPDQKLEARVRSKMGRYVSHPHAISVHADNGRVSLSGPILAHEAPKLLKCAKSIPGVQSVDDHLDIQDMGNGEPVRTGEHWDFMKRNWSPSTRVMATAVGGGLMLYGMKSHNRIGKATATLGLGLLTRSITNREMSDVKGLSGLRRLVRA
jgi:osmotically-inducible protein OsmY/predicted transcriptional regulator